MRFPPAASTSKAHTPTTICLNKNGTSRAGNCKNRWKTPYATPRNIKSVETRQDIYTITRAAKLNEYLFTLRVTAQAYRNGKPWGGQLVANVRRTMPYSDGLTLGKDEETNTIWRDMYNDAADQIVRQLGFLNPSSPAQAASAPQP